MGDLVPLRCLNWILLRRCWLRHTKKNQHQGRRDTQLLHAAHFKHPLMIRTQNLGSSRVLRAITAPQTPPGEAIIARPDRSFY